LRRGFMDRLSIPLYWDFPLNLPLSNSGPFWGSF
jgi:hypothetical protein